MIELSCGRKRKTVHKNSKSKKCSRRRVFRASAERLVNVYQITGCKVTVASFEITAPDRHSRQAEPKWQVAANIVSNRAASSWQRSGLEKTFCFMSFELQKSIKVSLIFVLLKIAINQTVYKSVISKVFIQLL